MLGGHRVPKLVNDLREDQRHRIPERTLEGEKVQEGRRELFPLPKHQIQTDQRDQRNADEERPRVQKAKPGRHRAKPTVRPHQRNSEKQVAMQQPVDRLFP